MCHARVFVHVCSTFGLGCLCKLDPFPSPYLERVAPDSIGSMGLGVFLYLFRRPAQLATNMARSLYSLAPGAHLPDGIWNNFRRNIFKM